MAGANQGSISVFDIEARKRVLRIQAHYDDVNAVAFADAGSSNVLISGSDDSFVKVWDRRSLSGGKPAGVLPGHTEGITYVSPKGDGRYCISNGKDQSVKLWDLRHMSSSSDFDSDPVSNYDGERALMLCMRTAPLTALLVPAFPLQSVSLIGTTATCKFSGAPDTSGGWGISLI